MTRSPATIPTATMAPTDGRMGADDPFTSTRVETLVPRRGPASLPLTTGLWTMIILALTVAGLALFLGGILTGVMLSGPGGPLADLREDPVVSAPPPPVQPPPAPAERPMVVIEPPIDAPPVTALPSPEKDAPATDAQTPPQTTQSPSGREMMEENPLKDFPADTEKGLPAPGQVIPQAKPTTDSPVTESGPTSADANTPVAKYAIQAGAFSSKSNASKRATALKEMGYEPIIKPVAMSSGSTLHVVYVGAYASPREAAADRRSLRAAGIETALAAAP